MHAPLSELIRRYRSRDQNLNTEFSLYFLVQISIALRCQKSDAEPFHGQGLLLLKLPGTQPGRDPSGLQNGATSIASLGGGRDTGGGERPIGTSPEAIPKQFRSN